MPDELPSRIIASIAFVGRGGGAVKELNGFRKGRHTVPDTANAATNAFLQRVCGAELAEEAEQLFQSVRAALGYKRTQIALNVTAPVALLTARDFSVEIVYALEERDASRFTVTTTLRELHDAAVARQDGFARAFAGKFCEISFALKAGVRVESVIDAIEALDAGGGMTVEYPSDCRDCVIRVEGLDAEVRCSGAALDVIFPRGGAPAELMDAFASVRAAFQISKTLRGLIG
jgi:hypothetical protein